jgi:hypothetical protein
MFTRKVLFCAIFLSSAIGLPGQANKSAERKRPLSLETVLSCTDDSLIKSVFATDKSTALLKLNAILLALRKQGDSPNDDTDLLKGFVAIPSIKII